MESSKSSKGKKIQRKKKGIPGRNMPLLKPVRRNPFADSPQFNWFMINKLSTNQGTRRYFFNMSRHPRHLPKVLESVLEAIPWSSCHSFFLLIPPKDFGQYRNHFPMATIIAKKHGDLQFPTDPGAFRRKLKRNAGSKKKNGHRRQKKNKKNKPKKMRRRPSELARSKV